MGVPIPIGDFLFSLIIHLAADVADQIYDQQPLVALQAYPCINRFDLNF